MALQLSGVPFKLTAEDMGTPDLISALTKGQQLGQGFAQFPLQQQILNAQAQYALPMAQQNLQKAILGNAYAQIQNQYAPQDFSSAIGLRNAQAGNYSADTAKTRYMLNHPGYFAGEDAKTIQYLMDSGILKPGSLNNGNNVPSAQQGMSQSSPPQGQGGMTAPLPMSAPQAQQLVNATQEQSNQQPAAPSFQNSAASAAPLTQNQVPGSSDDMEGATPFKTGNPMVDAILNRRYAAVNYQNKMARGFAWVHSPVDARNYQIAQLAGAGVDPSSAVQQLSSGKTVPEILTANGFDPNNPPDPDFLPTHGNIEKLKQRQSALKEASSLSDFVTSGLAPYSQTIHGYSPAQVVHAIANDNPEQQARFLAARALAPELTNVRLLLAQARNGKYAVQSMSDKSLSNVNAYQGLVTPQVFKRTQKLINEQLESAFTKSEEAYKVAPNKEKVKAVSNELNKSKDRDDPLGIR